MCCNSIILLFTAQSKNYHESSKSEKVMILEKELEEKTRKFSCLQQKLDIVENDNNNLLQRLQNYVNFFKTWVGSNRQHVI